MFTIGKKGDLLRNQKLSTTTYTFTKEQLIAHDKLITEQAVSKYRDSIFSALYHKAFDTSLQVVLTASSRVLVNRFHWKPADGSNRLSKFIDYLIEEVTTNFSSSTIEDFSEETFNECGVLIKSKED